MIGFQNGIKAAFAWFRSVPGVPQRPATYDPANKGTWPWPDKLEATMNDLVAMANDHEARIKELEANPKKPPRHWFWSRPGLFVAWGLYNGGETFPGGEPQTIARKARDAGFKWVALQWEPSENHARAHDLRNWCKVYGVDFVVWEAFPSPGSGVDAVNAWRADAYIAQAEKPEPWDLIAERFTLSVPRAIVTTFAGAGAREDGTYDPAMVKPLQDRGWACLTEAYTNESAFWTPDRLNFTGVNQLGWSTTFPVIGLWSGALGRLPAQHYIDSLNLGAYSGYSVWLTETMLSQDWEALQRFNQERS